MKNDLLKKDWIENYANIISPANDASDQLNFILEFGINSAEISNIRIKKNRIKGCKAGIWVKIDEKNRKVYLDSDSLIVKGVLNIIFNIYESKEILNKKKISLYFVNSLDEAVINSEIKSNGLKKTIEIMNKVYFEQ